MPSAFSEQYALVQDARAALLTYCETIKPEHFTAPVPSFNHASIRDLLVHSARAYHAWLGEAGLGRTEAPTEPAAVPDMAALRALFARVDALVADFEQHFTTRWQEPAFFELRRRGLRVELTPLQLFTHALTHEFHHKGQVLSMSRQLGYVPVDTDVIRT